MSSPAAHQATPSSAIDFAHNASAPASPDGIRLIQEILVAWRAADPATRQRALEFMRSNAPERSPLKTSGSASRAETAAASGT